MKEASETLSVTVRTIQRWDLAGKVCFVRTPKGRRRLPKGELNRISDVKSTESPAKVLANYEYGVTNKDKGALEDVTNLSNENNGHSTK